MAREKKTEDVANKPAVADVPAENLAEEVKATATVEPVAGRKYRVTGPYGGKGGFVGSIDTHGDLYEHYVANGCVVDRIVDGERSKFAFAELTNEDKAELFTA